MYFFLQRKCYLKLFNSLFVHRFRHPEGVAVDHNGYIYVADTGNHAIRMISPSGNVTTLAGTGSPGDKDGFASEGAQFSSPTDIAVWRDWAWWPYENPIDPDSFLFQNGNGSVVLFVADTGNHRIRKVSGDIEVDRESGNEIWTNVRVECFSGRCDNRSNNPQPGFADGSKGNSRFDSPQGLTVSNGGRVFVADTNNHLIRAIDQFGTVKTIAGSLAVAEKKRNGFEVEGCPEPCLTGKPGSSDGESTESYFTYPVDLALEPNEEAILVTDRHHVRRVDLSNDSVTTLAGGDDEGERDGDGSESTFNNPASITVTGDGVAYVVDSASCRIRRVSSPTHFVPQASCSDSLSNIMRPSGCNSYNSPIDDYGLAATPVEGNLHYNFMYRNEFDIDLGRDFIGRSTKSCVGSSPFSLLDKMLWNDTTSQYPFNSNLVIDDGKTHVREDPNDGSRITVICGAECSYDSKLIVLGVTMVDGVEVNAYSEDSSVCGAAHAEGILNEGGTSQIDVKIISEATVRSTENISKSGDSTHGVRQFFIVSKSSHEMKVQTISGAPSTLHGDLCGYHDSFPAQSSKVR